VVGEPGEKAHVGVRHERRTSRAMEAKSTAHFPPTRLAVSFGKRL
jgi:hypothetical protein